MSSCLFASIIRDPKAKFVFGGSNYLFLGLCEIIFFSYYMAFLLVSIIKGLIYISFLLCFSSVQFSHSVVSDSLRPHESQHARSPCPSPSPGVCSDSRPSSQWCHPAISSSVVPFFSCPQALPASKIFPQFIVIHTVKGLGTVNKAEIDVFLELSWLFHDSADVGNLISGSSTFSKSNLYICYWRLTRRILSITLVACETSTIMW